VTEVAGAAEAAAAAGAAAPVGGGMLLGFSVFIFCFNSASLEMPDQPFSIFADATFAFTLGGAIGLAGFCNLVGAATTSLSPCTFVKAPDFAAVDRSTFAWRSILRR